MKASIPCGLPMDERFRLLSYLKTKYQPGYFHKSLLGKLARQYGKDKRTLSKLIEELLTDGLIGEDESTIYLRSWKFLTNKKRLSTRAFKASLFEVSNKKTFEGKLFAAKIDALQKYLRFRGRSRVRHNGDSQIKLTTPTGYLTKTFQVSSGKVTKLKRIAFSKGFITVTRNVEEIFPGTKHDAKVLCSEIPGIYSVNGKLLKRKADWIISHVETYRIKSRKLKSEYRNIRVIP